MSANAKWAQFYNNMALLQIADGRNGLQIAFGD
jgi:hypothetical protein